MAIELDPKPPNRIVDLRRWRPQHFFRARDEVEKVAKRLGEGLSIYAAEIDKEGLRPWLDISGDDALSIQSCAKLYLLYALAKDATSGERTWDDTIELLDRDRSLFSGIMHHWPAGTRLSLRATATLMIAESDNTATDMVLHRIGRERAESTVRECGHARPELNVPFLSTFETWTLKHHRGGALGRAYATRNIQERRVMLDRDVAILTPASLRMPETVWPTLLDKVGWFASARDLAEVLRRLWLLSTESGDDTPLAILGVKSEQAFASGAFDYVGAMRGWEVGGRSLAYLVSLGGKWHAIVCVVNNSRTDVSDDAMSALSWGLVGWVGRGDPE
jgi:hypothetical protein